VKFRTVATTPLFILLAAAYFKRTGDRELLDRLWPNIERALHWLDHYGTAGAVFLILQACLGLEVVAAENLVRFVHPLLPDQVPEIRIRVLKVGSAILDL
jgi:hypothetical protein